MRLQSGGTERGESLREDGRCKHRVSEANEARSEALDRSDSGLSKTIQFLRLI
jgi:hypothetical protein